MTPLNSEPRLEKNYVVALILCMIVLLGYPFVLQKFFQPAQAPEQAAEEAVDFPDAAPAEAPAQRIEPAAAPQGEPAEAPKSAEKVRIENELYEAEFSTLGGTLTRLLYKGDLERGGAATVLYEDETGSQGIFAAKFLNDEENLPGRIFNVSQERSAVRFTYEKAGHYLVEKHFVLSSELPVISLDLTVRNLTDRERNYALEFSSGLNANIKDQAQAHEFQAVAKAGKVLSADYNKVNKKGFAVAQEIEWAGLVKKYFTILIKPEARVISYEAGVITPGIISAKMRIEPFAVAPSQTSRQEFFIYAGPQKYETLKEFDAGFDQILSRGILGELKILLLRALKLSHTYTHNFGWDIIILTIIIKLLFSPLTHISYKSMEKMKVIQPKIKALQEKLKDDPARMNREMMELYKKHKVNPMGGCLPMLLQIPIFIAFYQVLNETIELRGAPFIGWITNLSEPDTLFRLPFSIPLLGDGFHFLPLLMIASMVIQQRLTPQTGVTPEQQKIFNLMPLIFGFIFYKMPSGLVLYWFVNNVLSIFQQLFVRRIAATLHHEHP